MYMLPLSKIYHYYYLPVINKFFGLYIKRYNTSSVQESKVCKFQVPIFLLIRQALPMYIAYRLATCKPAAYCS